MPILTVYADGTVVGDIFANTAKYNAHSSPDWADKKAQIAYENDHKFDDLPRRYVSRPSIEEIYAAIEKKSFMDIEKAYTSHNLLPAAEEERRMELHRQGFTDSECAKALGWTPKGYARWRISRGLPRNTYEMKYKRLLKQCGDEIYRLYKENVTIKQIGEILGETERTISELLKDYCLENNIELTGKKEYTCICKICGASFTAKTSRAMYCNNTCYHKAKNLLKYKKLWAKKGITGPGGMLEIHRETINAMLSQGKSYKDIAQHIGCGVKKLYTAICAMREEAKALATQAN